MTSELLQLVYMSRARGRWDEAQIASVQAISQERNEGCGITGLLLFDGTRFIQALEGPNSSVRATMARIASDPRHDMIQYASDRMVAERQFGLWSMQWRRTPPGTCSLSFLKKVKQAMLAVDDPALQALFIGFTVMGCKERADGAG